MAHLCSRRWTRASVGRSCASVSTVFLLLAISLVQSYPSVPTNNVASPYAQQRLSPQRPSVVLPPGNMWGAKNHGNERLLEELEKVENNPDPTIESCARWARLEERYTKRTGIPRHNENMQRECEHLFLNEERVLNMIHNLYESLLPRTGELAEMSNLIANYVDILALFYADQEAANKFNALRTSDDQFNHSVYILEHFISLIDSKLDELRAVAETSAALPVARAGYAPREETIDVTEKAIKQLIDREATLDENQLEELIEMSDLLKHFLFEDSSVNPNSGRWRYLYGLLEAARFVYLSRVRTEEDPPSPRAEPDNRAYEARYAGVFDTDSWAASAKAETPKAAKARNGNASASVSASYYESTSRPGEAEANAANPAAHINADRTNKNGFAGDVSAAPAPAPAQPEPRREQRPRSTVTMSSASVRKHPILQGLRNLNFANLNKHVNMVATAQA